jgi:hypothetical protein
MNLGHSAFRYVAFGNFVQTDPLLFSFVMDKRKIKSHKGGRTERGSFRVTKDYKILLEKVCGAKGLSLADLIEIWVDKEALELGIAEESK